MKRKRCSEQQIAFTLRQHETGTTVAEIVRTVGITEQTFYRWKKKFGGMGVAEVRRLKQLEEENRNLKQLEVLGLVGVLERSDAGLQPAGKADGQRVHRVVQRTAQRGVSERALVRVAGRCSAEAGRLATGLQRSASAQCPGAADATGIRGIRNPGMPGLLMPDS